MDIALDEVLHFDAITSNPATGAVSDADSTPTWSIFEEDTDTAILSAQNFTKRTGLTGNYRGAATLSAGNGFDIGKWYNVVASATVNGVAGKAVVMRFRVVPAETLAGYPKMDLHALKGVAQSATDLTDFADTGYDPATHKVAGVVLVDTCTTNTDMRGTNNAMLAASYTAPDNSGIGAIKTKTDNLPSDPADASVIATAFTALQTHGDSTWATATGFSTFNPAADTVAHVTLVDTTTTNTDMRGTDNALLASGYTAPDNAGISAAESAAASAASAATTAASSASTAATNTATILARIGAFAGTGLNTILGFLRAMAAKATGLTPSELSDGNTFFNETDSLQAIRDLGNGGGECTSFTAGALAQLAAVKTITTLGPVITVTRLALAQGDDYLTADLTQLQFTNTAGSWPDLTGATVKLYIYRIVDEVFTTIVANGTVITPTGTGQRVDVDLPHAKSILLDSTPWAFGLVAILADDSQKTLRAGEVSVTLHPYGEVSP